jgi:cell division protein FtsB
LASEPHLRPVPPLDEGPEARPRRQSSLTLALTLALAIALALLAWNRTQLAQQVVELQADVRVLEGEVAERDRVIGAHQSRLSDVRARIERLRDVLAQPLPEAD